MGKAPTWNSAEAALVAQCWIQVSEDGTGVNGALSGSEQRTNEFWQKVMQLLEEKAPPEAVQEGRYNYRGMKPIKSYWRDQISKDCNAFNRKLMLVYSANPTGCTELDKISMAVAIHLGKVERMEYRFKTFEARNSGADMTLFEEVSLLLWLLVCLKVRLLQHLVHTKFRTVKFRT